MTFRILFAAILATLCKPAFAEDVSGRIDLDVAAPLAPVVSVGVDFTTTNVVCPEDVGILRISAAGIRQHRPLRLVRPASPGPTTTIFKFAGGWTRPIDDETYLLRITLPDCRFDIAIRQQILRDGAWISLLVPERLRPSFSAEERKELQRQFMERAKVLAKSRSPEASARFKVAREAIRSLGALAQGSGGLASIGAAFEEAPPTCFEAVADYLIDQHGIAFIFATGLPGGINRFVIERTDIDDDRSQFHFTHGDCRFELTIAKAVRHDGRWLAVPVAPFVKANEPKARIQIQRKEPGEQPE